MYRPEIKILDCTIRDGGLMNNWEFDRGLVRDLFKALVAAGVDYVELGYRADKKQFDPAKSGPWRFCDEEDLRDVAFESPGTKISVMCDVGRTDEATFLPRKDSIISMYRIASYAKEVDKAIHLGNLVKDLGYEVSINIMAASAVPPRELQECLDDLAKTNFEVVYLVDSFGNFYSEDIHTLGKMYLDALKPNGIEVGIHCHNNCQLAFANTIEGIRLGMNYLDGSVYGMGRAAGNCTTELLLGFLKNPKYDLRPALDLIERHFVKMHRDLRWGYEMPYMLTGVLNKHPRFGLKYMDDMMAGKPVSSFVELYDSMADVEELG
jgi:4-hydroxy 2-oxovalerate aldolase